MQCFSCGNDLSVGPTDRVGFRDACESCSSDLHVCLNCRFYDEGSYNECREPVAERVVDKDRGNRCDLFSPVSEARVGVTKSAVDAKSALDALFKK